MADSDNSPIELEKGTWGSTSIMPESAGNSFEPHMTTNSLNALKKEYL